MPNYIKKQGSTGSPVQSHSLNLWSIIIIPEIKALHLPDINDESTISHVSDFDNEMTAAFPKKKKSCPGFYFIFPTCYNVFSFEIRGVRIRGDFIRFSLVLN